MSERRRPALLMRVGQAPELDPSFESTLERLQDFVGGNIDVFRPDPRWLSLWEDRLGVWFGRRDYVRVVVNDEGIFLGLPPNDEASRAYGGIGAAPIFGSAVLVELD